MAKLLSRIDHGHIVLIFAVLFFVVYSYISLSTPAKFVSPDEVTNHFFIDLYSRTGELTYSDELNEIADGIIRPRHTSYIEGRIVPENFIGFMVIGGTVAAVSPEAVRFITPLLAVLGAIFLYLLLRDVFDRRVALLSFLLLLISAPYWYWSSLVMFEKVAGCAMLIISLRYFFKLLNTNAPGHYVLSGLFFGLALFIRPDYVFFGIPILAIALVNLRKIRKAYAGLTALALLAALGPFFILNNDLYGSFMLTGQHAMHGRDIPWLVQNLRTPLIFSVGLLGFVLLVKKGLRWQYMVLLIAGASALAVRFLGVSAGRFDNLIDNSLNLIELTPLLFSLGLLGFLYCLKKKVHWQYMAFALMCLLVLALYFLTGRVLATRVHSSYVRYFLPVYLLFLPFVSYLILSVRPRFVTIVLILAILGTGIYVVHPTIDSNVANCNRYEAMDRQFVRATEPDAVIFLEYWDKVIFPDRRVGLVRDLPSRNREERLSEIMVSLSESGVPVYALAETFFRRRVDETELNEQLSARRYVLSETEVRHLYALERDPAMRVSDFDREDIFSEVGELRDGSLFSTGRPGLLVSGPCVPMKAGEYTFVVTGAASSTASARVEVVSGDGSILHTRFALLPTPDGETGVLAMGRVSLSEWVADREVRLYVGAEDEVRLDSYEFIPAFSLSDFDEGYPFSQVGRFRDGSIVSDGREGFLVFGPYARMDAGQYMLVVTGAASSPVSAWVDVVSARGAAEHARFELKPTKEGGAGVLASGLVVLDEEVSDLEVRVYVGADDEVRLDGYLLLLDYCVWLSPAGTEAES